MELKSNFSELIVDQKPKTKWRESIFIITINTNKSYNSRDLATLEKMQEINNEFDNLLHNLFDKRNLLKLFVDIGKPGSKQRILLNPDRVQAIEANTQKEVNKEGKAFLHSHTIIKIIHDTRVLINLKLIRAVVEKKMEKALTINGKYTKPFVSVKGTKTQFNLEQYVK